MMNRETILDNGSTRPIGQTGDGGVLSSFFGSSAPPTATTAPMSDRSSESSLLTSASGQRPFHRLAATKPGGVRTSAAQGTTNVLDNDAYVSYSNASSRRNSVGPDAVVTTTIGNPTMTTGLNNSISFAANGQSLPLQVAQHTEFTSASPFLFTRSIFLPVNGSTPALYPVATAASKDSFPSSFQATTTQPSFAQQVAASKTFQQQPPPHEVMDADEDRVPDEDTRLSISFNRALHDSVFAMPHEKPEMMQRIGSLQQPLPPQPLQQHFIPYMPIRQVSVEATDYAQDGQQSSLDRHALASPLDALPGETPVPHEISQPLTNGISSTHNSTTLVSTNNIPVSTAPSTAAPSLPISTPATVTSVEAAPAVPVAKSHPPPLLRAESAPVISTAEVVDKPPSAFSSATPAMPTIPDLSSFSSSNYVDADSDEEPTGTHSRSRSSVTPSSLGLPSFTFASLRAAPSALLSAVTAGVGSAAPTPEPNAISSAQLSSQPDNADDTAAVESAPRNVKLVNFERLLAEDQIDLAQLRKLSSNGIPSSCRALAWKLLLGYLPTNRSRREITLQKRREEYVLNLREFYYCNMSHDEYNEQLVHRSEGDHEILKQIQQDVPRTSPGILFFKDAQMQKSLERVLFVFAIRHTASGYVQGMNDVVTPFYAVFLQELYNINLFETNTCNLTAIEDYYTIEADCFWCLSYLIDGIQDHYTFAQPGIQRMVYKLKELIKRIDGDETVTHGSQKTSTAAGGAASQKDAPAQPHVGLHAHLERENVQFMHFAFRWMNCLLMRELKLSLILRLWDSYMSEAQGFKQLHLYVCAAFLMHWKEELKRMDFQQIIQFLQKLPTDQWKEKDVETLLAQAHMYKMLFDSAPRHLQ